MCVNLKCQTSMLQDVVSFVEKTVNSQSSRNYVTEIREEKEKCCAAWSLQ